MSIDCWHFNCFSPLDDAVQLQVRLRKVEMEKRDAERIKRMEKELKEKHEANLVKRKKAEQRINAALDHGAAILRQKRAAFEQREAEAEKRRQELEVVGVVVCVLWVHVSL